ncbi:21 kDa protein-like [Cornus florida]|uniref:21 kDa protein-like n=1 Tax=Cornus florida TaxID=4283 RepID=UPI00289798C6|nr:21 kDa protein-like [Cornus florida]
MEGSFSNHFLATLLILLAFTSYTSSAARVTAQETSNEFIRTSCTSTTYPKLCYTSLSTHASVIQTSAKLLAHTALSVTLHTARSTSAVMLKLSKSHGMKPREAAAMSDCIEELSDSVDQLRRSLGEMKKLKGSNFELMMSDIQTWVSAAMTDDDTCTTGFAGNAMNGKLKTVVRGKIVNIAHLTSNALALINSYASLHS